MYDYDPLIRPITPVPATPVPEVTPVTPPASTVITPAVEDTFTLAPPTGAVPARGPLPAQGSAASDRVETARTKLEEAGEAAREKEEELKTTLARVGPGLNAKQIRDLQRTFREEHKEIYAAEEAAAEELARALKDPSLSPEEVAAGYAELAKSPSHAEEALKWASAAAEVPGSPYSVEELTDIAGDALDNSLARILERSPDADTAFATLRSYLGPLTKLGGGAKGVKEAWSALKDAQAGNYDKLGKLADTWDSKLSRSIGIAAVAFGALSATNAVREGEYLQAIESLGNAGSKGIELLVGFTQAANRGVLGGATPLGAAALRFSGALTAVASAASFALDLKAFLDGKGTGYGVAAVGDLIAFAGGVTIASGVGAPLGALLIAVGTVVSTIGRIWGQKSEREKLENELADLMRRAGIPEELVGPYSKHFEAVNTLAQAGYTPQEIQELVRTDRFQPFADNWEGVKHLADAGVRKDDLERFMRENPTEFAWEPHIRALVGYAKDLGLEGGEIVDFAAKLRETAHDGLWGEEISPFFEQQKNAIQSEDERLRATRSYIEDQYPEAFEFAKVQSPELFTEDAEIEQQARLDVEELFQNSGTVIEIAVANDIEDHKDDPVYLDAYVSYLRELNGDEYVEELYEGVAFYQPDAAEAYREALDRTE